MDFVFVDRSFSSLWEVAYWTFGGKPIEIAFKILTRWTSSSWTNYNDIKNCYKLLGADPNDHVVTDLASMKNAVAKHLIQKQWIMNERFYKNAKPKLNINNHLLSAVDH